MRTERRDKVRRGGISPSGENSGGGRKETKERCETRKLEEWVRE